MTGIWINNKICNIDSAILLGTILKPGPCNFCVCIGRKTNFGIFLVFNNRSLLKLATNINMLIGLIGIGINHLLYTNYNYNRPTIRY